MKARESMLTYIFLAALAAALPKAVLAGDAGSSNLVLADASGSISIISPTANQVLKSGDDVKLKYNVRLSPNGNHIHVYVDNHRPIIDHDVQGCPCTLMLPSLAAGKHRVVMKEATVHHHLTGVSSSVTFSVQSAMSSSGAGGDSGYDSGY